MAELSVHLFLYSFAGTFLLALLSALIGSFLYPEKKEDTATTSLFIRLFIGFIVIALFTAFCATAGLTILWLLLPAIIAGIKYRFLKTPGLPSYNRSRFFKDAGVLIILAFIFSLKANLLFHYQSLTPDYVFYSRTAYYLWETGQENTYYFFNTLDNAYHGMIPYHYPELWLTAFLQTLNPSGFTSLHSYLCIAVPFFNILLFTGLLSLLGVQQRKLFYVQSFFVLILFFTSSFYPPITLLKNLFGNFEYVYSSVATGYDIKFSIPVIILIIAWHVHRHLGVFAMLPVVMMLPICSYATLPAAIAGSSGILFYLFIFRKRRKIAIKTILLHLVYIGIITAGLLFVYNGPLACHITAEGMKIDSSVNPILKNIQSFVTMRNILLACLSSLFIFSLVWLIAISPLFRHPKHLLKFIPENYEWHILVGCMLLGGMSAWALLNNVLNSVQLYTIIARIFLVYLVLALRYLYLNHHLLRNKFAIVIFMLAAVYGIKISYDAIMTTRNNFLKTKATPEFSKTVIAALKSVPANSVAYMKDSVEYQSNFNCYPTVYFPFNEIAQTRTDLGMISMSETDCYTCLHNNLDNKCKAGLSLGFFYRYCQKRLEKQSPGQDENRLKREFIRDYKIRYLFTGSTPVWPDLSQDFKLLAADTTRHLYFYQRINQ